MRTRADYYQHFDRAAASFGAEPFSSRQLQDRVVKAVPSLRLRPDMTARWSAPYLEAGRLVRVGTGPKGSYVYRRIVAEEGKVSPVVGKTGPKVRRTGALVEVLKALEETPPTVTLDTTLLTWPSIDVLLAAQFTGKSFKARQLITAIQVAYPAASLARVRSKVSTYLVYRVKTGAVVVTTPGKKKHRWYRPVSAETRLAAAEAYDPAVAPSLSLYPDMNMPPIIADVSAIAPGPPPDATAALAAALGTWLAESLRAATDAMTAVLRDREASFAAMLRVARLARLDELAATLPDYPRLFAAVEEIRRKEAPVPAPPLLPGKMAGHVLTYDAPFTTAFAKMVAAERDQMTKALHLLVHNGSHYPSLATKLVDRPLPGAPKGAWVSRAGDWRFTWEKTGRSVRCHTLFRRGDAVGTYGSEA